MKQRPLFWSQQAATIFHFFAAQDAATQTAAISSSQGGFKGNKDEYDSKFNLTAPQELNFP